MKKTCFFIRDILPNPTYSVNFSYAETTPYPRELVRKIEAQFYVSKIGGGTLFVSFAPAVSKSALKSMRKTTRKFNWRNRTDLSLNEIARRYNQVLSGWINYYERYRRSALYPIWRHFNKTLVAWVMRKYKTLQRHKTRAAIFLEKIAKKEPHLFAHWREGMEGAFA